MMTFTEALTATRMPGNKGDAIIFDPTLPGLGIRFRNSGDKVSKTWAIQYRIGNRQRRESLGDIRKVTLIDARKIARQRFAKVELGVDPAAEKATRRRAQYTLRMAAEAYLTAKHDVLRRNTYRHVARYLHVHWVPLLDRPLVEIGRADVAACLNTITKNHGRAAAGQARRTLSALFSWAAREGRCESNPVAFTNNPAEGAKPRQRVLTDPELVSIWIACGDDDFGRIVRLLILTGCRRDEIGGLRWDEIDVGTGHLTIPGARTKNGHALDLSLPVAAMDILHSVPRREGAHVFGRRNGTNGFYGWSYAKIVIDQRIHLATGKPLAPWRLHDIRRTFRTGLSRIGIAPHVAERAINHVKGGVEAVYDKHRYEADVKGALERWANHVVSLTR
jgi:integrase